MRLQSEILFQFDMSTYDPQSLKKELTNVKQEKSSVSEFFNLETTMKRCYL